MRLISYQHSGECRIAGVREDQYVDLRSADPSLPSSMKALLALGPQGMQRAAAALAQGQAFDPASVRLLAPVPDPQKIICVGLNYADHARETNATVGNEPVIFNKFPTTLRAAGDEIVLPSVTNKVDYEAELVAVIGQTAKNIERATAMEYIAGYTIGNDVSARDWQKHKPGGQWLLGKSFDSFAPCGPCLVTPDEVGDPQQLNISLRLNGETMQSSNTNQLIFKLDFLVAYLSTVCTLLPGDLIYTGTPSGVGAARDPKIFLKAGDQVEVEIERLGVLRNPVV